LLAQTSFNYKTIGIDGIDGSGKSTLIQKISKGFNDDSHKILRSGGIGGTNFLLQKYEKYIRDDKIVSSSNRKHYIDKGLVKQYKILKKEMKCSKIIIQDRTFISYFAGFITTSKTRLETPIDDLIRIVRESKDLLISEIHFIIIREFSEIVNVLKRRNEKRTLSVYDRYLFENQEAINYQQEVLKDFAQNLNAVLIYNNGTEKDMYEQFLLKVREKNE